MDNIKRNGDGYYDPTAFQAIKNTEKGAKKKQWKYIEETYSTSKK